MNEVVAKIVVALIAASATVLTAYSTSLRDRRNERARLLQDLEIVDKLTDGVAKDALRHSIDLRALDLSMEQSLASASKSFTLMLVGALVFGTSLLIAFDGYMSKQPWARIALIATISIAVGLFAQPLFLRVLEDFRQRIRRAAIDRQARRAAIDLRKKPMDDDGE
jgi:small-conductance mechanosensitive channel